MILKFYENLGMRPYFLRLTEKNYCFPLRSLPHRIIQLYDKPELTLNFYPHQTDGLPLLYERDQIYQVQKRLCQYVELKSQHEFHSTIRTLKKNQVKTPRLPREAYGY